MKYIKLYENKRFKYGDYIIYKRQDWKNTKYPLIIMSINGTPGPTGSKYDYYTVNEVLELIDGELVWNKEWNPKSIPQKQLEDNTVYHTNDLDDAKKIIFIISDENKYNL